MPHVKLNHRIRNDSDVALIVGSRVGETDWWGKPPYWRQPSEQKTIQIDLDSGMLGLNKPVDLAILADARRALELLGDELERRQGEIRLDGRRARVDTPPRLRLGHALRAMNACSQPGTYLRNSSTAFFWRRRSSTSAALKNRGFGGTASVSAFT